MLLIENVKQVECEFTSCSQQDVSRLPYPRHTMLDFGRIQDRVANHEPENKHPDGNGYNGGNKLGGNL